MRLEKKFKVTYLGDIHDASIILVVDPGKSNELNLTKFAKCTEEAINAFKKSWGKLR